MIPITVLVFWLNHINFHSFDYKQLFTIVKEHFHCSSLKIDEQTRANKFEEEIKQEQEERRREEEDKKRRREEFKNKANFFANQ